MAGYELNVIFFLLLLITITVWNAYKSHGIIWSLILLSYLTLPSLLVAIIPNTFALSTVLILFVFCIISFCYGHKMEEYFGIGEGEVIAFFIFLLLPSTATYIFVHGSRGLMVASLLLFYILISVISYILIVSIVSLSLRTLFGGSKLARIIISVLTLGIIGGFVDFGGGEAFFGGGGEAGAESIAEAGSEEVGTELISEADSKSEPPEGAVSQEVFSPGSDLSGVIEWSGTEVGEHFSTYTESSDQTALFDPELEYVEGYMTDQGVKVEGYTRTVADGVEWNNLNQR